MDQAQRKEFIRTTFNTVASGYDRPALRFFQDSATHLVEQLELNGDERVLDAATGTGAVALLLGQRLPRGQVTGIDMSDGMLAQARLKASAQGLTNVDFRNMDMTALRFPTAQFDCATAAFALFFVKDMPACLRGIAQQLRPGGQVVICAFSECSFAPAADLFMSRLETYGVVVPPMSWKRLGDAALNQALFEAAGLHAIEIHQRDLSYHLTDAEAWWDVLWYAGFRGLLNQLSATDLERFRAEHLAEIGAFAVQQGIPLRIEVLYTRGRVPTAPA